jgi:hypothetical protein
MIWSGSVYHTLSLRFTSWRLSQYM